MSGVDGAPEPALRPIGTVESGDPTWERLEDQIGWYDRKSGDAQRWYKRCKLVEMVAAAAIPVTVGIGGPSWIGGLLGGMIVVLEGGQHLYQHQEHWITYRSTCEALRHERYLYLATAGPYASTPNPHALLAERIEGLVSQEHAKWASSHEEASHEARPR